MKRIRLLITKLKKLIDKFNNEVVDKELYELINNFKK